MSVRLPSPVQVVMGTGVAVVLALAAWTHLGPGGAPRHEREWRLETPELTPSLRAAELPDREAATRRARNDAAGDAQHDPRALSDSAFAALVERLSEPRGYFDSDNLISNEASYLHVLDGMREIGVRGGAYIGVGPDQNFAYIAAVRPALAFVIDIRRDNLLQHLMFKSIFEMAPTRLEFLSLLLGRRPPAQPQAWEGRPLESVLSALDEAPLLPQAAESVRRSVRAHVQSTGLRLPAADLQAIDRIHREFIEAGLDLRFTSFNRPPRPFYPTYRMLLLERDLSGRQASYLASEDAYRTVRAMQHANLIIPVVGNLAGDHALPAIAQVLEERGERVSAFYTSNVEFYLLREGSFPRFAASVRALPRDHRSVIIRSYFGGTFARLHPQAVPGYYSTQLLQTIDDFTRDFEQGRIRSYMDLVMRDQSPNQQRVPGR